MISLSKVQREYMEDNLGVLSAVQIAKDLGLTKSSLTKLINEEKGCIPKVRGICSECGKEFYTNQKQFTCSHKCMLKRGSKSSIANANLPHGRYSTYRRNAKNRRHNFDLSFDEFMEFWQEPCVYCGSPIDTIGLDREDNDIGYTVDNVVPCCSICNYMKRSLPTKDFLDHIDKISNYSRS